jgi:hypothetical protein
MKFLTLTVFITIFSAIAAFPSVGTSTGVMRQKIMLRRTTHRNQKRNIAKISKEQKIISFGGFLNSMNKAKKLARKINAQKQLQRLKNLTKNF